MGFDVEVAETLYSLCAKSRLIVTTTPADKPLLTIEMIQPGSHITAMGSDTPEKNEVSPEVLALADIVVSDSLEQSHSRGEIHQARIANAIPDDKAVELGVIIADPTKGRSTNAQITIADLTGVAVQDIAIAKAVMRKMQ